MLVIYHGADLDGQCSGLLVKWKHPDAVLWPIDYGDTFNLDAIKKGERVYLLDFTLEPWEKMEKLIERCRERESVLVWIDHHKTVIEEWQLNGAVPVAGVRAVGKAACELTWRHLFPDRHIPAGVELLGRYDVWDHVNPRVYPFQMGFRLVSDAQSSWTKLFTNDITFIGDVTEMGQHAIRAKEHAAAVVCKASARGVVLYVDDKQYECIAVNMPCCNSKDFASVWDPEIHDCMVSYYQKKDGKWTVSFYSPDDGVDVGKLCKALGGGGHEHAAGFTSERLPVFLR